MRDDEFLDHGKRHLWLRERWHLTCKDGFPAPTRTTYGVQGATLDTTRYHPTDGSGFEEGYVALTRGRRATKVYVFAGTVEEDELSHMPAESVSVGVQNVADSLARRRANAMVADRSDNLADVVRVAAGTAASDVEEELLVRFKLHNRPRDFRAVITRLAESLDAITARQRLIDNADPTNNLSIPPFGGSAYSESTLNVVVLGG